jgi:selenoprotein W-related protein
MPDVSITYCKPCGYERRATDTAAALQRELNVAAKLIPGAGGVFDVKVGGKVVASKMSGRFPEHAEVVAAVGAALKSSC